MTAFGWDDRLGCGECGSLRVILAPHPDTPLALHMFCGNRHLLEIPFGIELSWTLVCPECHRNNPHKLDCSRRNVDRR